MVTQEELGISLRDLTSELTQIRDELTRVNDTNSELTQAKEELTRAKMISEEECSKVLLRYQIYAE